MIESSHIFIKIKRGLIDYYLFMVFRPIIPVKMERFNKKILIISIVGTIIMILGIIIGSLWITYIYDWAIIKVCCSILNKILSKQCMYKCYYNPHIFFTQILTLSPSSVSYSMWKETPIPMYFKFYMFNWTNPHEFQASSDAKPNFEEMGPYVFRFVISTKFLTTINKLS